MTIQGAIDEAVSGDTLHLAPIRFAERISIDSSIVVSGYPFGGTILDIRNQPGYGVHLRAGSPTVEHLTILSDVSHQDYALHNEPGVTGMTLRHLRVIGNATSGIDLNGLTSQQLNTVEDCEVFNSAAGFGLAMSSCQNVRVHGFTSYGNSNGDIGVLESAYTSNRTESLKFSGDLKLLGINGDGLGGIVIQSDSTLLTTGLGSGFDIDMRVGFIHKMNALTDFDGAPLGFLLCNTDNAAALSRSLTGLADVNKMICRNIINGEFEVWPGMRLQDAIDAAESDDIIRIVLSGDYDVERVLVDKPLTILGPNEQIGGNDPDRDEEARMLGGLTVASPGVILNGVRIQASGEGEAGVIIQEETEDVSILNSVIRGNVQTEGLTEANGIEVLGNVDVDNSLIQGWTSGMVLEQGHLTVNSSSVVNNGQGLQFASNGVQPSRLEGHGMELINVGGDAIVVTSAMDGDSLLLEDCTGELHRYTLRFDTLVDYAIEGNTFSKAEVQGVGLTNEAKIGLCELNDFIEPPLFIIGCMDPLAVNYEPCAVYDPGLCLYAGCTDAQACNFDPNANQEDGSCEYLSCAGCMDDRACNYNEEATLDDGSCEYSCRGCTQSAAVNYDPSATLDNGSCRFLDCDHPDAEPSACIDEGSDGCTDQAACNFNAFATVDDGTCEYTSCLGCTDEEACNYDSSATVQDGTCLYDTCTGCTDSEACNFDPDATVNIGCLYPEDVHGSADVDCEGVCLEDSDEDGICDGGEVTGCTNFEACNFDPLANEDNGSCEFTSCAGCTNPAACNFDDTATLNDGSCTYEECTGCTDEEACNFDGAAVEDDGTCADEIDLYNDSSVDCDGQCVTDADEDGICDEDEQKGCMEEVACNFNPLAEFDDGSCEFTSCAGCTDASACNYNEEASIDDGTCSTPVTLYGSDVYDCKGLCANDVDEDGICDEFEVPGCQDLDACNYDAGATDDDGSCTYPPTEFCPCYYCLGDLNFDGIRSASDILILLTGYGCTSDCGVQDVNCDGVVNAADVLDMLTVFGTYCP